jgi:hypothetical protein
MSTAALAVGALAKAAESGPPLKPVPEQEAVARTKEASKVATRLGGRILKINERYAFYDKDFTGQRRKANLGNGLRGRSILMPSDGVAGTNARGVYGLNVVVKTDKSNTLRASKVRELTIYAGSVGGRVSLLLTMDSLRTRHGWQVSGQVNKSRDEVFASFDTTTDPSTAFEDPMGSDRMITSEELDNFESAAHAALDAAERGDPIRVGKLPIAE